MNGKAARYFAGRPPHAGDESDSDVNSRAARAPDGGAPARRRRVVARVVSHEQRVDAAPPRHAVGSFEPIAERARDRGAVGQLQPSAGVAALAGAALSSGRSSSESESQSESESESAQSHGEPNEQQQAYDDPLPSGFRPQFVNPTVKDTMQQQQMRAQHEEKRFRRRRDEARQLVTQVLDEEDRQFDNTDKQLQLPDDTDYEHDRDVQFALWRVRELRRIKRDREAQKAWQQRTTSTAERKQRHQQAQPATQQQTAPSNNATNSSLQSAYKLGPFFMDKHENGRFVQDIYNRDYTQPTEGDNYDKTTLPKPLQLSHGQFGRSGRSNFTQLAAEHTAKDFINEVRGDPQLEKALNHQKPNS